MKGFTVSAIERSRKRPTTSSYADHRPRENDKKRGRRRIEWVTEEKPDVKTMRRLLLVQSAAESPFN